MDKKEAIDTISELYPIDSQYLDTKEIGKKLLIESIEEVEFDWRELPDSVLIRLAYKCLCNFNDNLK